MYKDANVDLLRQWLLLDSTNTVIIFRDILMFDQIFISPQVKRIMIISNMHGIYEV